MAANDKPVLFYLNELGNYWLLDRPLVYKGLSCETSEHAFQCAKFLHEDAASIEYAHVIASAKTPNFARILAQQKVCHGYSWRKQLDATIVEHKSRGAKLRPDWEEVKESVMLDVLLLKFSQDARCQRVLMETGSRPLVEHTPIDKYWGDGGDGSGKNRLGKLLEMVREEFRSMQ